MNRFSKIKMPAGEDGAASPQVITPANYDLFLLENQKSTSSG